MSRWGSLCAVLAAAVVVSGSAAGAGSPSTTCTSDQKARLTASATAYWRSMPAARKRYFAKHKRAADRTRFVQQQYTRLSQLKAAASCTVPPPPPSTPSVSYQFGPGVDQTDQESIRGYLDHAATDELALTGVAVQATAYVSSDPNWLGQADCTAQKITDPSCPGPITALFTSNSADAIGLPGATCVDWSAYDFHADPALYIQKILAHELFHVIQFQVGMPWSGDRGPVWLVEGAAEYIGYRVTADLGFQDYTTSLEQQKAVVRGITTPLDELEAYPATPIPQIYYLYEVAADHLVSETSVSALMSYFAKLGQGMAWQDAFKQAFGQSIDTFYGDVAAYRATL